jgi:hemerythrin-like metal-binding protein
MHKELIRWNDSLGTGIKIFDDQHKKLFEMLNDIFTAIIEQNSKPLIKPIVEGLIDYTNFHFKAEEQAMIAADYKEYELHKSYHDQLLVKVRRFQDEYNSGVNITTELFNFLKEWILVHIMKEDKKYGPYLKVHII